jgi:outer membrane lipoprotein-sorting protein
VQSCNSTIVRWGVGVVSLFCLSAFGARALSAAGGDVKEGEKILKQVEAQFAQVKDYVVTVDAVVDVERLKIPPMHLTMYYKYPDKVHFDSEGFVLLPREGMALPFSKLSQRYSVDSVGTQRIDSVMLYRLVLRSKEERNRTRKLVLLVHPRRWTPEHAVAPFQDGSSMTARFEYAAVNSIWMPSRLEVNFQAAPRDTTASPAPAPAPTSPFGEATPTGRFVPPRSGRVTVSYSNYKLNTGLSDEIFTKKEK